jgi:hypothetical protein
MRGLAVQFGVALGQVARGHLVQGGDFGCNVAHHAAPFIEGFPLARPANRRVAEPH